MIIGLSGYAQVGKDTIADYLVEKHGFVRVSFADPIREALYTLNPAVQYYSLFPRLRTVVDALGWEGAKTASADIRELLQRFGTEIGREMFGKDFWVNQGLLRAKEHENVVFADVRFVNEADAIKEHGGDLWRITKSGHGPVNGHPSETALDDYPNFDLHIKNDLTKEDLYDTINMINLVRYHNR